MIDMMEPDQYDADHDILLPSFLQSIDASLMLQQTKSRDRLAGPFDLNCTKYRPHPFKLLPRKRITYFENFDSLTAIEAGKYIQDSEKPSLILRPKPRRDYNSETAEYVHKNKLRDLVSLPLTPKPQVVDDATHCPPLLPKPTETIKCRVMSSDECRKYNLLLPLIDN